MTPRYEPSILDRAAERGDWDNRDPHSICLPLKRRKAPDVCHCPPPAKNRLGGQHPAVDREAGVVRCRSCLKPVSERCKRKNVQHLRALLNAPEGHVDWASISDLMWVE